MSPFSSKLKSHSPRRRSLTQTMDLLSLMFVLFILPHTPLSFISCRSFSSKLKSHSLRRRLLTQTFSGVSSRSFRRGSGREMKWRSLGRWHFGGDENIPGTVWEPRGASGRLSRHAAIFLKGHEILMGPESIIAPACLSPSFPPSLSLPLMLPLPTPYPSPLSLPPYSSSPRSPSFFALSPSLFFLSQLPILFPLSLSLLIFHFLAPHPSPPLSPSILSLPSSPHVRLLPLACVYYAASLICSKDFSIHKWCRNRDCTWISFFL